MSLIPPNPKGAGHATPPRGKPASTPDPVPAVAASGGSNGLIAEAEALRDLLRDALVRVNQLLLAAKQQKRQGQLLRSTLAALKQLQNVQT